MALLLSGRPELTLATAQPPDLRWFEAAEAMPQLALPWGAQAYGAVLLTATNFVAEGPGRVIKNNDPNAHAEREAIRDARRRLGVSGLSGATLYSTSRPCLLCKEAAARANVTRIYLGPAMVDPGQPRR